MAAIMSGKAAVRAVGIIVMGLLLVAIGMGDYTITAEQDSSSLVVRETIDPGRIFLKGLNRSPETARVTLTLEAPQGGRLPVDLVLVMDRSATMDIPTVREAGREIIGLLGGQDRAALVSFADEANLDLGLTFDSEAVGQALERLRNEGKTGLGEGIAVATTELINNGRLDAIWVGVVLMEGRNNTGRDPRRQAEIAAEEGITIFTAGIGRYVDRDLLGNIAETTGGLFFETFSDVAVEGIGARILQEVVAKDITVTKTLPSSINFEESFTPVNEAGTSDPYPPDRVINEYDGATTLEWEIEELKVDESWEAEFEISAEEGGEVSINSGPSTVEFANSVGKRITIEIPAEEIEVEAPPEAEFDFSPSKPELGKTVTFDPVDSTDPNGNIVSCEWDFGDDTDPRTTSCDKVSHVYDRYGTFEVTLTVEDREGLKDEATVPITIGERPLAEFMFHPEDPLPGEEVTFDASGSHDSDGHITSYEWDFGDGYRIIVSTPITTHAFTNSGSFSVRLIVVDNDDFTGKKVKTIVINEPPEAEFSFSPRNPTTQDTVQFTDESYDPGGEVDSWEWDFGDGSSSSEQHPSHRYIDNGTFRVELTVTDDRGATATASKLIAVANVEPTANFAVYPSVALVDQTVTFDASESRDPDGQIVKYEWDFDGDDIFDAKTESSTIEWAFEASGERQIKLMVTDDDGASATVKKKIEVLERLVSVYRKIDTHLHTDITLAGQSFVVTVEIDVEAHLYGLGLAEDLPEGWKAYHKEDGGATPKGMCSTEAGDGSEQNEDCSHPEWIFPGEIEAGGKRTIIYEVSVPEDEVAGAYRISGQVGSASPKFEASVGGESQVTIVDNLPISWVISRWDTENDQFNTQLDDLITTKQFQQAVAWWIEGHKIKEAGDAVIDLGTMEELVAYWLTDTPVYESLP